MAALFSLCGLPYFSFAGCPGLQGFLRGPVWALATQACISSVLLAAPRLLNRHTSPDVQLCSRQVSMLIILLHKRAIQQTCHRAHLRLMEMSDAMGPLCGGPRARAQGPRPPTNMRPVKGWSSGQRPFGPMGLGPNSPNSRLQGPRFR